MDAILKEQYAFISAWSASIWKRIWRCAIIYSKHQNIPITHDVVLKCFKYNILSPTGIVQEMLPSLKQALKQGFLMPKEYGINKYVKRAVALFGEAYSEKLNIKEYAHKMDETNKEEYKDILGVRCDKKDEHCCFCQLIKVWDIDLNLFEFEDNYHALLVYCLIDLVNDKK